MKQKCFNHPEKKALSFCHACGCYFCEDCLVEGLEYWYCKNTKCQKTREIEQKDEKKIVTQTHFKPLTTDVEIMKRLTMGIIGSTAKALTEEGYNRPINMLELLIYAMFIVGGRFIDVKKIEEGNKDDKTMKLYMIEMGEYASKNYGEDSKEFKTYFGHLGLERFAEYDKLLRQDLKNPNTIFSNLIGAFLGNLFVPKISEKEKSELLVPLAVKFSEFISGVINSFK